MKKKNRICFIFNYPPHYRLPIYSKVDELLDTDFYFGDKVTTAIKPFDVTLLKGFKANLTTVRFMKILTRYKGLSAVFKGGYKQIVVTGDITNISSWFISLYCRFTNKECYLWTHGLMAYPQSWVKRAIQKLYHTLPSGCFVYCEHAIENMIKMGISPSRLFPIHNCLDTELLGRYASSVKLTDVYSSYFKNSHPTIIYIGRIQKRKKLRQIFEAIKILKSKGTLVNCVLVGNNVDAGDLEILTQEMGLDDQVWFYGSSYNEEKNSELLYNASACISPGNVGLTSIHSLSYGTPVITHNNFDNQMPEYAAVEEGITGSFYQEDDIEALAAAIKRWCTATQEERELCRVHAKKMIEQQWSVNYQAQVLCSVLKH